MQAFLQSKPLRRLFHRKPVLTTEKKSANTTKRKIWKTADRKIWKTADRKIWKTADWAEKIADKSYRLLDINTENCLSD